MSKKYMWDVDKENNIVHLSFLFPALEEQHGWMLDADGILFLHTNQYVIVCENRSVESTVKELMLCH